MTDKSDRIEVTANVGGDLSGQLAGGKQIRQEQWMGGAPPAPVTDAELAELRSDLAQLQAQVTALAPPELRAAAQERAEELAVAATKIQPDLTTIEYVRNWFGQRLPQLRDALTSLVFHPILAKLVAAGGDALVAEFRHRFGG